MSRDKLIRQLKTDPANWQAVADHLSLLDDFPSMLQKLDAHQYVGTYEINKAMKEAWEAIAIEEEATRTLEKPIKEVCSVDTFA